MPKIIAGIDPAPHGEAQISVRRLIGSTPEGDQTWQSVLHGVVATDVLGPLLYALNVDVCVIDARPDHVTAFELQKAFPNVVWLCFHIRDYQVRSGQLVRWDDEARVVYAVRREGENDLNLHLRLAGDRAAMLSDEEEE